MGSVIVALADIQASLWLYTRRWALLFHPHSVIEIARALYQPCLCLCLGFFLHITYTLPFRLTTLHPSHMGFTEERTFMPRERSGVRVSTAVARCTAGVVGENFAKRN